MSSSAILRIFFSVLVTGFVSKVNAAIKSTPMDTLNLLPGMTARFYRTPLNDTFDFTARHMYLKKGTYLKDGSTLLAQKAGVTNINIYRIIYEKNDVLGFYMDPEDHYMLVELRGYFRAPFSGDLTLSQKVYPVKGCDGVNLYQSITNHWIIRQGVFVNNTEDGSLCINNSSMWFEADGEVNSDQSVLNTAMGSSIHQSSYYYKDIYYPFTIVMMVNGDAIYTDNHASMTDADGEHYVPLNQQTLFYDPNEDLDADDANYNKAYPNNCPVLNGEKFVNSVLVPPIDRVPDVCPLSYSSVATSSATTSLESSSTESSSTESSSTMEYISSMESSSMESSNVVSSSIISNTIESSSDILSTITSSGYISSTIKPSSIISTTQGVNSTLSSDNSVLTSDTQNEVTGSLHQSTSDTTSDISSSILSSEGSSSSTNTNISSEYSNSEIVTSIVMETSSQETADNYPFSITTSQVCSGDISPSIVSYSNITTSSTIHQISSDELTDSISYTTIEYRSSKTSDSVTQSKSTIALSNSLIHTPSNSIASDQSSNLYLTVITTIDSGVTVTYTECPVCRSSQSVKSSKETTVVSSSSDNKRTTIVPIVSTQTGESAFIPTDMTSLSCESCVSQQSSTFAEQGLSTASGLQTYNGTATKLSFDTFLIGLLFIITFL